MSAPSSRNDIPTDVDGRIARRLRELRDERGYSLSEARLPPRARITFEKAVVDGPPPQQQVWVIKGELHVQLGDTTRHLTAGDCMAMTLDQPVTFQAGASLAHYVVATSNCP